MNRIKSHFLWQSLCVLFMSCATAGFAQITLTTKNQTIRQAIHLIEKYSEYRFFYNNSLPGLEKTINLHAKNQNIESILNQMLQNTGIGYQIDGNKQIVLIALDTKPEIDNQPAFSPNIHKLTGTIIDALTGESLPGVNIVVPGTQTGVISDLDGHFSLEVPPDAELDFSYIGYARKKIHVGEQTQLRITLNQDIEKLDEVIVVGYGTQRKVTLTGSVVNLSGEEIKKSPAPNIMSSLAGQLPGLIVSQRSGEPGRDDPDILVRGAATLGDSSPLIIIDGVERGYMSRLNPEDIESYTVLKDASAAIYGARAANGVILITTKRGKEGKPVFSFSMNT
ncbi:MAG: TonB-dependent receptor, partial [Bacteroidetes bacterium]|nr:TonB-dependent receptor [Bacteroidota bacterium]